MGLLEEIAAKGWNEKRAEEFERRYRKAIRWRIVVQMERLGLLQMKLSPERVGILSDKRLELFQNTESDINIKLLNGLIPCYLERKKQGRVKVEFLAYVSGTIRKVLVENARRLGLLGEETPYELLQGICQAKRERKAKIAWAKYCLEAQVRWELLDRCPSSRFQEVYKVVHHVSDYFFEVFVPGKCELLKRVKRRPVVGMVEALLAEELDSALGYIGKVTPYARMEEVKAPEELEDEEAFLDFLSQEVGRME
ncbi:MAG TPA: hypothetical protein ENF77_05265 [Candidatus Acetothermia bacterium]|nr:hypothetical protein [Candidatus Acetothermia bacterium]